MGADGGVMYVPVKKPTPERHARVVALLKPFWQFLDRSGVSREAEEGLAAWEKSDTIVHAPNYILGLYGTDRGDNFDLEHLEAICTPDPEDHLYYLYDLTFNELDLDCRTTVLPIKGEDGEPWPHRLWYQHFHYSTREEVLKALGPLASMRMEDWVGELNHLLNFGGMSQEETWT